MKKKANGEALLAAARRAFHRSLVDSILVIRDGVASNADRSQRSSFAIALSIAEELGATPGDRVAGQRSGHKFEALVSAFLNDVFLKLDHLRPGKWAIHQIVGRSSMELVKYAQYSHLEALKQATTVDSNLAAALGNDYSIAPDVVVVRSLEKDDEINRPFFVVDREFGIDSDLREGKGKKALLHASISTKWTLAK